jgi:hypothetical protein
MAAPTFSALYKISVRRADGGISFRPKTHRIVSEKVIKQMAVFATKADGNTNAATCGGKNKGKLGKDKKEHTPFKRFRGCLRSSGHAMMTGSK